MQNIVIARRSSSVYLTEAGMETELHTLLGVSSFI